MSRILPIIKKEFRQIARDKHSLAVQLFIPLFLLLMFGYAISLDVKHISLAVLDLDGSGESRALAEEFRGTTYFDLDYPVRASGEIDFLLGRGLIDAALVIPAGLSKRIIRNEETSVQVIVDGSNANTATTILGYANGIVERYSTAVFARIFMSKGIGAFEPPIDLRTRVWFNPELSSARFLVPGLIALILLSSAVISTAMSVVREKERGSMEQLLVSPVRPFELIAGKTIPYVAISLAAAGFILLAGRFIFGVRVVGNAFMLFGMTLVFLLSSLGIGLLISTITDSQQAAFMISTVATLLPSFVLSGFVFPIHNMPLAIQAVTYLIPARYFVVILRSIILKGAGAGSYWQQAAGLAALAVLTLAGSGLRIMRRKA
jgi:ABC-2 type transport system permease protein